MFQGRFIDAAVGGVVMLVLVAAIVLVAMERC